MPALDYGTDISTFPDLDPTFSLISGNRVLEEAIARRITTERGSLIDAPNYGTDVRTWLNEGFTRASILAAKNGIERECQNEERLVSAAAAVTLDAVLQAMGVKLSLVGANGPFQLLLAINAVSTSILAASTR